MDSRPILVIIRASATGETKMGKNALLSAVIASTVLLGCATAPPERFAVETTSLKCNGTNRCWVKVGIDKCGLASCDIYVNFGLVEVLPNVRDDASWELFAPGYQFPNDGVVFEEACRSVFTPCNREANGQKFVCKNNHPPGKVQTCKYTIKLTGPLNVNPLDPFFVNE
jgi:hypothetical protein